MITKKLSGFTLIELMLVVALLGIMGAIVMNVFISNSKNQLELDVRNSTQASLTLASSTISKHLRGAIAVTEAQSNSLTFLSYAKTSDAHPTQYKYYLENSAFVYTATPAANTGPVYTFNQSDAKKTYLINKVANTADDPLFTYYNDANQLLGSGFSTDSVRQVEVAIKALDEQNRLKVPIELTVFITLRND